MCAGKTTARGSPARAAGGESARNPAAARPAPGVGAPAPRVGHLRSAPGGGRRGRRRENRFAPPPPGSAALGSLPARLSLDPPLSPRPNHDGRGLPPLPPAAPRGPPSELQGLRSRVRGTGPALAGCRRSGEPLASLSPGPRGGRGGTRLGFSCAACPVRPARPAASWELEGRGWAWLCPRPAGSWTEAVWDDKPGRGF